MGTPVFVENRLKNGRDVTDAGVGMQFSKIISPQRRKGRKEIQG
jgi:hypothetical protein